MKALVKAKAERGIWMENIKKPKVGHNDVLIKVNRDLRHRYSYFQVG